MDLIKFEDARLKNTGPMNKIANRIYFRLTVKRYWQRVIFNVMSE